MEPKLIDWKRVNPKTDLRYSPPAAYGGGTRFSVKVEMKDPDTGEYQPIYVQGPKLRLPFGFEKKDAFEKKDKKDEGAADSGGEKYHGPMSFPTVRCKPGTGRLQDDKKVYVCDPGYEEALEFMKFLQAMDEANKAAAVQKSSEFFRKEIPAQVVEAFYYPILGMPKEPMEPEKYSDSPRSEKYSPTLRTKLKQERNGGAFVTKFWDRKGKPLEFGAFARGQYVIPILETTGLWFGSNQFGMSIQLTQVMGGFEERKQFLGCAIKLPPGEEAGDDGSGDENDGGGAAQGTKRLLEESEGAPAAKVARVSEEGKSEAPLFNL